MEALVGRLLRVYMRERSKEERRESGYERRTFSARRREDDRMEGLVAEMAISRFSTTKFRGLMVVVLLDAGALRQRVEKRRWRWSWVGRGFQRGRQWSGGGYGTLWWLPC
ncbi:hypothetical protein OIU77_006004 [Salix suchowensis]|uniref:Uncharacterized protein n=1 Tax=Salix suchowensis TaxID=1278906 RepID=A0ABQ9ASY4_9ROSI|nr:hypothetical protein OIU77_006004 [Salix suchowensis]